MKKFFKDLKDFAMKGNILDMAIGVVIGGAFGKIVSSLVADIITPLISLATGSLNFTDLKWVISKALTDANGVVTRPEVALTYGNFLQAIIDFVIIVFSIFAVMRLFMKAREKMESLKKKEQEAVTEAAPVETELDLLKEIRDLMKDKK